MTSYASHWVVTISALLSELKVADGILCIIIIQRANLRTKMDLRSICTVYLLTNTIIIAYLNHFQNACIYKPTFRAKPPRKSLATNALLKWKVAILTHTREDVCAFFVALVETQSQSLP